MLTIVCECNSAAAYYDMLLTIYKILLFSDTDLEVSGLILIWRRVTP